MVQAQRTSSNPSKRMILDRARLCLHKIGVVQANRTSNPLKTHDIRESKVCRAFSHKFRVVQAHRPSSNPLKTQDIGQSKVCRVLSHKFGVVQTHRTSSNPLKTHDIRESKVCRAFSHRFGVVQAHQTSSNPLKTHIIRESKVCRVLSHKFGLVQAHRISSNPLKTHDIRESKVCRAFLYKFGVVQAHRTSSNPLKTHDIRESKVCRAMSHKFVAHRTSSNPLKTLDIRESKVCRALSHKFGVVQPHRTSSNPLKTHNIRESHFHIRSGWFKHIDPHRTPSKRMILGRARCVEICLHKFGVVQAHQTSSNLLKTHDKTHDIRESKVCSCYKTETPGYIWVDFCTCYPDLTLLYQRELPRNWLAWLDSFCGIYKRDTVSVVTLLVSHLT